MEENIEHNQSHEEMLALALLDESASLKFYSQNPLRNLDSTNMQSLLVNNVKRKQKKRSKLRKFHSLNSLYEMSVTDNIGEESIDNDKITYCVDMSLNDEDDKTYSFIESLPIQKSTLDTKSNDSESLPILKPLVNTNAKTRESSKIQKPMVDIETNVSEPLQIQKSTLGTESDGSGSLQMQKPKESTESNCTESFPFKQTQVSTESNGSEILSTQISSTDPNGSKSLPPKKSTVDTESLSIEKQLMSTEFNDSELLLIKEPAINTESNGNVLANNDDNRRMAYCKDNVSAKKINDKTGIEKDLRTFKDLESINYQFEQVQKMMNQFDKLKQAKISAVKEAIININKHTEQQIQKMKRQERKMIDTLNEQHQKEMEHIENTEKELRESLKLLQDALLFSKSDCFKEKRDSGYWEIDNIGNQCINDTNTKQQVKTRLDDMLNEVPNIIWQQRSVMKFVGNNDNIKLLSLGYLNQCYMSPDLDHVTKSKAVSFSNSERKPYEACQIKRKAKSELSLYKKGEDLIYELIPFESLAKPRLLTKITDLLNNPIDACFLPNGNLLIAELGQSRLHEISTDGLSVQIFDNVFIKPKGITVTYEGYIACTDEYNDNIKVFTRGGEMVCQFGTGYFKEPGCIDSSGQNIYIVCDNEGPYEQYVYKYNAMTGEKKHIGYDNNDAYVVSRPEYVCLDRKNTGNIIISDSAAHCVWVFDKDTKLLFRFGNKDQPDNKKLSHPKGTCIDNEGNILVADCANHRIVKYSGVNGQFLSVLLDASNGIHFPHVVQFNNTTGKLAVVQDTGVLIFMI